MAAHGELQIPAWPAAEAAESWVLRAGVERRLRLERLRHDLAERAAALATAQGEVATLLAALDAQLGWAAGPAAPSSQEPQADARVAAIKMTLRERQRIHAPSPVPPPEPAPVAIEPVEQATVLALPVAQYERRRWWRPWQRAAA